MVIRLMRGSEGIALCKSSPSDIKAQTLFAAHSSIGWEPLVSRARSADCSLLLGVHVRYVYLERSPIGENESRLFVNKHCIGSAPIRSSHI